ncbi:PREDICTED: uncharacterized protein LOC109318005 [Crocodylus porosus]|uniref:uncharacterized protein LOC109318005 n=1 Tax=Crocodylus porosus TaxID=8502 RepID=UPI00093CF15C|nr:PREDICTED: uncharacterized protein LOC109318005 [Crocodylus porosus]
MGHRNPQGRKAAEQPGGGEQRGPPIHGQRGTPCQGFHPPGHRPPIPTPLSFQCPPRANHSARVIAALRPPAGGAGVGAEQRPLLGGPQGEQRPLLDEPGRAAPPTGGRGQRTGGHVPQKRRSPAVRLSAPPRAQPRMGPALHPPDSPSARGEATVQRLEAAQPVSGTPGAIRMRHLCRAQRTQRDGIQEELLRAERAHLREAREYRQQVLAEFCRSRHDQALFLEEVEAGRVALQQLVAKIMEERQLAQDSYEELRQLQASINTAIQERLRVSQQLLATIPTLAAHAAVPQPMPAPVLAPGPPDQPMFPPPGRGPSWEHCVWLVAQVVLQQPHRPATAIEGYCSCLPTSWSQA